MLCCLPKCFLRVSHKWQTWTHRGFFCLWFTGQLNASLRSDSCQNRGSQAADCKPFALPSTTASPSFSLALWRSDSDSTLSERLIPDPSLWNCIPPAPERTPWPCCAFLHSIPHCLTYSISSLLFHSLNYQSSILRSQTSFTAVAPASKCSCGINEQMNKLLSG